MMSEVIGFANNLVFMSQTCGEEDILILVQVLLASM